MYSFFVGVVVGHAQLLWWEWWLQVPPWQDSDRREPNSAPCGRPHQVSLLSPAWHCAVLWLPGYCCGYVIDHAVHHTSVCVSRVYFSLALLGGTKNLGSPWFRKPSIISTCRKKKLFFYTVILGQSPPPPLPKINLACTVHYCMYPVCCWPVYYSKLVMVCLCLSADPWAIVLTTFLRGCFRLILSLLW